jgi:hypothetical protein
MFKRVSLFVLLSTLSNGVLLNGWSQLEKQDATATPSIDEAPLNDHFSAYPNMGRRSVRASARRAAAALGKSFSTNKKSYGR